LISGKSSKKKKKKKNVTSENELIESLSKTQLSAEPKTQNSKSKPQSNSQPKTEAAKSKATASHSSTQQSTATAVMPPTDPAKRIKNLRKRLREIESIEQKIAAGEQKLEKDQLDKVARKAEVMSEIEQLTIELGDE
jgi:uncharacterized protein with WD repeat